MNCKYCSQTLRKDNTRGICYKCWNSSPEGREYKRIWTQTHQEQHNACGRAWKQGNREKVRQSSFKRYEANKTVILGKQKIYYDNNREARSQYQKDNRLLVNVNRQKWLANNPEARLGTRIRGRIGKLLKKALRTGESTSAVLNLGCTLTELKVFIESKFAPGMSWSNWSKTGWHLDHITPLCAFDLKDPEQFKKACHYSNLQPLWAVDNLSKSGKFETINPTSDSIPYIA